jgi:hypothetical protein
MEVLTAYVRQHAPWPPQEDQEDTEDESIERGSEENLGLPSGLVAVPAPDPDIQAIATVLRRRTHDFLHGEPERIGLYNTNLSGVDLFGAPLRSANLWDTNLSKATLMSADLAWAHLQGRTSRERFSLGRAFQARTSQAQTSQERISQGRTSREQIRALRVCTAWTFDSHGTPGSS